MKKRVFIIHGYTGYPQKNWFPWLKAELEKFDIEVSVPTMPHTNAPQLQEWLPHLQKIVSDTDANTYFVGHSLGCATILRYLETLDDNMLIGGAVLVAGFAEPIHLTELDNFTAAQWDDAKIKQVSNKLIAINSDNDPHVPLFMGEHIRDRFGAKLIIMHDAKHINEESGHIQVPEILENLKGIMDL